MASLFRSCQIAVVGSGTTALEALALGTPMVAVVVADNQRPVADELARLDLAATADGRDTDAVVAAVVDLLKDEDRMRSMAWRGPAIVDARGALRVAAVMRESTLSVRPASLDDADMLLEWRNDASTRAASFDSACIERDEHMRWLRGVLANPDTIIAVGELERRPFGVIRLDRHGDGASVSVTVAPWARQLGVAAPLIRRALDQAAGLGVARVYAHIRAENAISQRAFHGAGFILSEDVEPGSDSAIVMVAAATSTEI
jgi:RimJ/RimL family protein N-acetyltransferase